MTWTSRQQIADLAVRHRLPGIHLFREYAEAGLLLAYGPSAVAQYPRVAPYIDKILKGGYLLTVPSRVQPFPPTQSPVRGAWD